MLDVHPPHAPTHTWRDFLIHIATICVGLLIAIGLEQTVELFHHRHQRHELEQDLITEAQNNLEIIKLDRVYFNRMTPIIATLRADAATLQAYTASAHHPVDIAPLELNSTAVYVYFTDQPVWNTAKEGGLVALLSRQEAAAYDLVYGQQTLMTAAFFRYRDQRTALSNFYLRFTTGLDQQPDLAHLSPEDLREYTTLLADLQGDLENFRVFTEYAHAITQEAAQGSTDDHQIFHQIGITHRH